MADVNAFLAAMFFPLWAAIMGSYCYFRLHVAPLALRSWSKENSRRIVEKQEGSPLDWLTNAKGSCQHLYRIVTVDDKGQRRSGLALVGKPLWPCLSSSTCPFQIVWDSPAEAERRSMPAAQLMVFCFAIADLIISALLLIVMSIMTVAIAIALDEMCDGAWGFNQRLGRVPSPDGRDETRLFLLQMLGMLAGYFAGFVTMADGGIGMLRRRIWGYYAHLAGSVLVVITGLGIIYAIPSLLITRQPSFRAYFTVTEKAKPPLDPFADL
jgi:hypothetical protein